MIAQLVTAGACVCGICLCIPKSSLQTLREKRAIKLIWRKLVREKNLKTNLGEYYTIGSIEKIKSGYELRIITPVGFTNSEFEVLETALLYAFSGNVSASFDIGKDREIYVTLTD